MLALIQILAWHWSCDKPLSEPMMAYFTTVNVVSVGPLESHFNKLIYKIQNINLNEMHLKESFTKCQPFYWGFNVSNNKRKPEYYISTQPEPSSISWSWASAPVGSLRLPFSYEVIFKFSTTSSMLWPSGMGKSKMTGGWSGRYLNVQVEAFTNVVWPSVVMP